ncbi:MAG TPA: M56 family metallopeptidase [Longimicrobiales bacterium]|nr:M56 family metallopeptidase [Longimicrobiales bacterium]
MVTISDAVATGHHVTLEQSSALPWLGLSWAAGFAAGMVMLFVGLGRLMQIAWRAERVQGGHWPRLAAEVSARYGLKRPIALLRTDAPDMLATLGLFRPRVLLPAHADRWDEDRVRIVLCHEIAHVVRHDWFVQISAEVLRTIYWFNPLLWLVCNRLRRESEQACDDVVLEQGVPAGAYATTLLDLARICRPSASTWASAMLMLMARPSTLERRIGAMLNPGLNHRTLTRRAIIITVVALLSVTLPTAVFRTVAQNAPLTVSGSVYDVSGAVLPQVSLMLEAPEQFKWQATTDASGRFEFAPVGPGRYVLEASLPGFRSLRQEFELRRARDGDRAITLQVGSLQETVTVVARRASGRAPSQTTAGSPLRVGGNIRPPRRINNVAPVYPQSMRDAGLEGVVPMEALIGRDGNVTSVRVLSAQVHPELAIAAVDAVRQWRFDPTLLNGESVEVAMQVSVRFSLAD